MRVLIGYMPFGIIQYPHLGTALLSAAAQQAGHTCDVRYLCLEFGRFIGLDAYSTIEGFSSRLQLGERVFARLLNPDVPSLDSFYREVMQPSMVGRSGSRQMSRGMYDLVRKTEAKALDWLPSLPLSSFEGYDVFAFSTSYEQNVASLALAKRLKHAYPSVPIVFGGSNCAGSMGPGLLAAYPWIDFICIGEGERCFVQLLSWLEDPSRHQFPPAGMISREMLAAQDHLRVRPDVVPKLDDLPFPDYTAYFRELEKSPEWRRHFFALPIEGSRGCWYAHRSQCVFCGLNGPSNAFRQKSPERYEDELRRLVATFGVKYLMATDNIASPGFLHRTFTRFFDDRPYAALWQEVRPDTSRSDLELLMRAGIRYIGVGVESLSTHVLKIMRKGTSLLDNIRFLRDATELGFDVTWQILCGFPGEEEIDYSEVAAIVPAVCHLHPPKQVARISIDRHSPLYAEAAQFGLELSVATAYRYIYGNQSPVSSFAYCFEDASAQVNGVTPLEPPEYTDSLRREVQRWNRDWAKSRLEVTWATDTVTVHDTRRGRSTIDVFQGIPRAIIAAAAIPVTLDDLMATTGRGGALSRAQVRAGLAELIAKEYVLEEGDRYLFLGIDYASSRDPKSDVDDGFFLRALSQHAVYSYE